MSLSRLRTTIRLLSFLLLTYGGYLGIRLVYFLPCLACPYVKGCSGHCYLMGLQGSWWGLHTPLGQLWGTYGLKALGMFAGFSVLTIGLARTWCGWICPFGTFQDCVAAARDRLGIPEMRLSARWRSRVVPVKFWVLLVMVAAPLLMANAGVHEDFKLLFCQVCPAKPIMPALEGNFQHLALDTTNPVTLIMTALSVSIAAFFLVGMFFKNRFFCLFCPMIAIIHLFERISPLRLHKNGPACVGCGNCRRNCPLDIQDVYEGCAVKDVSASDCMGCYACVESCPQDDALWVRLFRLRLLRSSWKRVAGCFRKDN